MNGQNNTNIYWNHLIIFSVTIFNIYFAFIVLLILTVDCWSVLQITDCVQGKTLINSLNPLQHCLQRWRWSPPAWWVGYGSTKAKYKKRPRQAVLSIAHWACLILVVSKGGSCLQHDSDDATFFPSQVTGMRHWAKMVIRKIFWCISPTVHCSGGADESPRVLMLRWSVYCVLHCVMDS